MFVIMQFGVMALAALLLLYLFEVARSPNKEETPASNSDPSDAEVAEGGAAPKPVNRIKKYRF